MRRLDLRRARGLTLIEMMVALVVSSIVALGIFAFASIQQATSGMHTRSIRVQQALDGAMWSMSQDIRTAGLGFARLCTELRIWDQMGNRLINPGAYATPQANAVRDQRTGEAYWVLRDGIQANWNSSVGGADFTACRGTGPDSPNCAADTFDVIMGERNYVGMFGAFIFADDETTLGDLEVTTATAILDPGNVQHVDQVRQLFPPGSFVLVRPTPDGAADFAAAGQKQCPILQITGDVRGDAANNRWLFPVDGDVSDFNSNKAQLLNAVPGLGQTDLVDLTGNTTAWVVPLGRLRWSRYAVDYTAMTVPYLVRYDLIGFIPGIDPANLGGVAYPSCAPGTCRAAGLHLPDHNAPPRPVAIGPMIEDMQVAVGCDGWSSAADDPPEVGFEDRGPNTGPLAGQPNLLIDEHDRPDPGDRQNDEWLGNAQNEIWAPDCVFYGTAGMGATTRADWVVIEGNSPPPNFRMSPQTIRITLIGAAEETAPDGSSLDPNIRYGLATDKLMAVEDRPELDAPAGWHERFTLTERFTPRNLRWRDPDVP
jgi:prepilin-type N-terminal cleavage/methylation domain-containing protein